MRPVLSEGQSNTDVPISLGPGRRLAPPHAKMVGDRGVLEWLCCLALLLCAIMVGVGVGGEAVAALPEDGGGDGFYFDEAGYDECMRQRPNVNPYYKGAKYSRASFKIIDVLQKDELEAIFLATDRVGRREVVIKVFGEELGGLFKAEKCFMQHVRSPIMPQLYLTLEMSRVFLKSEKSYAIVMEYLKGQDLRTFGSEEAHRPQILNAIPQMFTKIGGFFRDLHRHGLFYRDTKPENIMMLDDGTIRLVDFGLAGKVTTPQPGIFTIAYACPALVERACTQTGLGEFINYGPYQKTDEYGLAMVLLEVILGGHPRYDNDDNEIIEEFEQVFEQLDAICGPVWGEVLRGMLQDDPTHRTSIDKALEKYQKLKGEYERQRRKLHEQSGEGPPSQPPAKKRNLY